MDILALLQSGQSKENTTRIVDYIGRDEGRMAKLFRIFMAGPYRITQRASWPLGIVVEKYPDLLIPYYNEIIMMLQKPNEHDAVRRNILRMLQYQTIPEEFDGQLLDLSFRCLEDKQQPIAIRVFAMQLAYNISEKYPEIKPELKLIIEEMMPFASAGVKSRAKKIMAKLDKI